MLPHQMSVMFSWANHICGDAMLFMSLDPVVSFLLWRVISTEYHRQFQLLFHLKSVARQYLILQNSASSQSIQKGNTRILQPLQPRPKHFLSNRRGLTRLQQNTNIPSAHKHLMYPEWLKICNPSSHMFVTTFNKLSNATSPTKQATHQDADSTNAFPSPPGNQRNGDHFFLRREY